MPTVNERINQSEEAVPPVMDVHRMNVSYTTATGSVAAVRDASFYVSAGETVGIVGESGSGKSSVARSSVGLEAANAEISGDVRLNGVDLRSMDAKTLNEKRGTDIGFVFQDPTNALNPALTIRTHLLESIRKSNGGRRSRRERAIFAVEEVGIPNARERIDQYPHHFSGGMRQRICLALAMINDPSLLIADEPTTALDVTIQAQILDLLAQLKETRELAILLITHDMGVVARMCDRVMVMYAGRIVEEGGAEEIFEHPRHPYTSALLDAVPNVEAFGQLPQPVKGLPYSAGLEDAGCAFRSRCPRVQPQCDQRPPFLVSDTGRAVACWHPIQ